MGKIKISIVVAVWGTEHLLKRSIQTWAKQDFPKDEWELIVINDNALGDVKNIIDPYRDRINIQYIEFNHNFGMRGNTISLNTGWMCAKGEFLAESTPETMWPPNLIRILYEAHEGERNRFVMFKTYNLTHDMQLKIDTVDWRKDLGNLKKLDGFDSEYVQLNYNKGDEWETHQTDSIRKDTWYNITDGYGWPLFCGYGEDDPYMASLRKRKGIVNVVVMDVLAWHQHHLPFDYFSSLGHAPNLNKKNHTMSNYMNDVSGNVPKEGTCEIFDGRKKDWFTDDELKYWRTWDEYFINSGGDKKYLTSRFDFYKNYGY